jgi:hypothetical protein
MYPAQAATYYLGLGPSGSGTVNKGKGQERQLRERHFIGRHVFLKICQNYSAEFSPIHNMNSVQYLTNLIQ